jgi:cell volume regulation protein A
VSLPTGLAVSGFGVPGLTMSLLIGTIVMLAALAAVRISAHSGLPTMVLYLGIGLALGDGGLGIRFDDAELTQVLGYSALVLILAEGGLTTSWQGIRRSVAPAAVLSTVGVLVSTGVVAVFARLLGQPWSVALLLGAVLASTDAAAVFSVLRTVPLPRRLSGMLEAESGFNDAPVVILTIALAMQLTGAEQQPWQLGLLALFELLVGGAIGLGVGWAGGQLVRRLARSASGLFAIGVVSVTVFAYAAASLAHASGFLAAYLAALALGNMGLPHRAAVHGFAEALGTISQIGLFVLLGLLASPARLPGQIVPAVVLGLVLLLVARPLSVLVSLTPFRVGVRDQLFLSWAGLRGAVPVVLATVPLTVGADGTLWIFDFVFVLVLLLTLVQAPSLPWVARRLRVTESVHAVTVDVETTPLEQIGADVVMATVGLDSRLHGVEVFELRLPKGANVTLLVRGTESLVPQQGTRLRHGDRMLIVTPSTQRAAVETRLIMVSRHGRLAGWTDRMPSRTGRPPPKPREEAVAPSRTPPEQTPRRPAESS